MIQVNNLSKTYPGGVMALDGVSLAVDAGEMAALVGANGSGKTTLLRILAGRLRPTVGTVRVLGEAPLGASPTVRSQVGFAPQRPELDPEMSGAETLRLMAALYGLSSTRAGQRHEELEEDLGLTSFLDRPVGTYSGGQRQRLSVALALQHEPRVLLLDEPTAGLDSQGRARLWRQLRRFRGEGGAVVVITHDLAGVEEHAQRVLVLHQAKEVAAGSPDEIRQSHARPSWALRLSGAPPETFPNSLRQLEEVEGVEADGDEIVVKGPLTSALRHHLMKSLENLEGETGVALESIRRREADLAAAFRELTGIADSALRPAVGGGRGGRGRGRGSRRGSGQGRG